MSSLERIPSAMAEKFSAITALTDAFCEKRLNGEYQVLINRVVGTLARKRPSPLLKGKENVWAAGAVHAVGTTNSSMIPPRLRTASRKPSTSSSVAESTGQNKSKQIRNALGMGLMHPDWTLPSRLADNPLVWMVQINGLIIDIRRSPPELQRLAYEKGLIPFIPAGRSISDP